MNKIKLFFLTFGLLGFVFSFFINLNILSVDILLTLPSYASVDTFHRPLNSISADPVFQFEPWRHYAKNRLNSGEIPFINIDNALGSPFFANQQSAIFFPLQSIYNIFPATQALFLIYFLKIYCLILFFYLYFRAIKIEQSIALFGAFCSPLVGFFIVWLQWPHTSVLVFFPLVLYFTEKILQETRKRYIFNIALSFSYLGIVLAGHPETAFQLLIAHLLYVVIRFRNLKLFCSTLFFSFVGILLGAFSILPFLEYLLHSYALGERSVLHATGLPLLSFVVNLAPLIFGGPHLYYYKPLWDNVNFQEIIGGYAGLAMLITAGMATVRLKKNSTAWYWVAMLIFSFFFAYGIFPFNLLNNLPVFSVSANHRFIGFFGLSILVLSTIYISELFLRKKSLFGFRSVMLYAVLVLPFVLLPFILSSFLKLSVNLAWYLNFIKFHFFLIYFTTLLFFVFLNYFIISKRKIFLVLTYLIFLLSALSTFQNYNPFTEQNMYYPQTDLTKKLSSLPRGTYLEVGNPQLTENLNLMYGLTTVENYDAIEIDTFRKDYDLAFPDKNQWGNPDTYTKDSLNEFAIRYVISDYNLNFEKDNIYTAKDDVLAPLLKAKPIRVNLPQGELNGIRVLPATFNRHNSCEVYFEILDKDESVSFKKTVPCTDFYNNMFFNLETGRIDMGSEVNPVLKISTNTNNPDNAVSFFGSSELPYLAVLREEKRDKLMLVGETNVWKLYENKGAREIVGEGELRILERKPEKMLLEVENEKPWLLEVKQANFPGWIVRVDGDIQELRSATFLAVNLPQGKHLVEFSYIPLSFYVGSIISVTTLIVVLIYFLRNVVPFVSSRVAYKSFQKKALSLSWYKQVLIGFTGAMLGIVFYISIINLIKPRFMMPVSSAINWYTINGYPRQQDYFYFITSFIFILFFALLFWFITIYIWIKVKK